MITMFGCLMTCAMIAMQIASLLLIVYIATKAHELCTEKKAASTPEPSKRSGVEAVKGLATRLDELHTTRLAPKVRNVWNVEEKNNDRDE
jgi:hypothetical protein